MPEADRSPRVTVVMPDDVPGLMTATGAGDTRALATFDMPLELRNQVTRVEIAGERDDMDTNERAIATIARDGHIVTGHAPQRGTGAFDEAREDQLQHIVRDARKPESNGEQRKSNRQDATRAVTIGPRPRKRQARKIRSEE